MESLTFLTYSLGCRVNQAEIEEISRQLINKGFRPFPKFPEVPKAPNSPNLILVNTCVVTQKAERETRKTIRNFRRLYPNSFFVVLGCGVDAKQKLKINLSEADLLISNTEKAKASRLISQKFSPQPPLKLVQFDQYDQYLRSGRQLLKIQGGCDQFCTYCIVPYLRGKPKSQTPEEIIGEIEKFRNLEIKEVILTGINLGLYGKDLSPQTNLGELLRKILKEMTTERISLSSLDPQILNKEFAEIWVDDRRKGQAKLSRYWHLALQSGSPTVLQRMGRKTDLKNLLLTLQYIKELIPEFILRADILVGFPGETEKEFGETLQFIKEAKISFVHVFPFSKRPGTGAQKMIDEKIWQDLPVNIKRGRAKAVIATAQRIRAKEAKKLIGKVFSCLFIRKLNNNIWETLADNSWKVVINDRNENLQKGTIKEVKIVGTRANYLLGEILAKPVYFWRTFGTKTEPSSCW
jgi:threonylcarbamoyladenosine tRNA methylthiotransferase MtaB